ncbi:MAG: hypothetical protein R8P61_01330 [Bacteroidia bacterium]|nr:hypothetical protein [Bacteroidia bacterium]
MPGNKLSLSDLAVEQIEAIFTFHENSRKGKGSDFLEALWDCLEDIQEYPGKWQYLGTSEEKIRRAILKQPQSIILYSLEGEKVIVYEVYDSRQNWK